MAHPPPSAPPVLSAELFFAQSPVSSVAMIRDQRRSRDQQRIHVQLRVMAQNALFAQPSHTAQPSPTTQRNFIDRRGQAYPQFTLGELLKIREILSDVTSGHRHHLPPDVLHDIAYEYNRILHRSFHPADNDLRRAQRIRRFKKWRWFWIEFLGKFCAIMNAFGAFAHGTQSLALIPP
jgi:hypothetical protein